MPSTLIIRNLTTQPLTLTDVKHHVSKHELDSSSSNNGLGAPNLALTARIAPFSRHNTQIPISLDGQSSDKRPLHVTLQDDEGHEWRLELRSQSCAATQIPQKIPHEVSRQRLNAIYLPQSSILALCDAVELSSWMSHVSDSAFLSTLSIPGTHNSATHHLALPSVRCQAVSIETQLTHGVRFLDLRLQPVNPGDPEDETLNLVHGAFPVSLTGPKTFRALVTLLWEFLHSNPSETLILSIKREGIGSGSDADLAELLFQHYASGPQAWYLEPRIPRLGEVRGRIVLLRRFALSDRIARAHSSCWDLNAHAWENNTPFCMYGDVCVQDFCNVLAPAMISTKIDLCCEHFARTAARAPLDITLEKEHTTPIDVPGPMYLNFLSASSFWRRACWPENIAKRLNPAVLAYLCERHGVSKDDGFRRDGGVGVVVCDWIGLGGDWDLVQCVIAMNNLLQRKAVGRHTCEVSLTTCIA